MRTRVALLAVLAACAPAHVQVNPIPPNLPPEQRVAVFQQLHAVTEKTMVACDRFGRCGTQAQANSMQLANGADIANPEDVLELVPPDSEPARHAHASSRARTKLKLWAAASAITVLPGMVLTIGNVGDNTDGHKSNAGLVAGVVTLGFAITAALLATHYHNVAVNEASYTFHTYNDGLAWKLNVCVSGFGVVPCENGRPDAAPPSGPGTTAPGAPGNLPPSTFVAPPGTAPAPTEPPPPPPED